MKKTIRICSREWDLKLDPKMTGGEFNTYYPDGKGTITIGTKWKKPEFRHQVLLHEILEAVLVVDVKRYKVEKNNEETSYLFVFDHEYLEDLAIKLLDALLSCGLIKRNDGKR